MRGSVGSQSDGANQRHRKSHGGGRDEETAVTPVSSPPVASVSARHEVGLPCVGHTLLPQASAALGSGLQESSWLLPWGPSLLCPGLELFARHLLCLHFIRASALVSFPDHPVSNQDSLPSYPLHLPAFPALLFLTALAYLLVQCVIACPPPPPPSGRSAPPVLGQCLIHPGIPLLKASPGTWDALDKYWMTK